MLFSLVRNSNHKTQGDLGEARAVYEYTKLGYTVLKPLSEGNKYDFVIDDGSNLLKVQVKTSRCKTKSGGYEVCLKTSGGNTKINTIRRRARTDYDLLFVLTENGKCWSIPSSALGDAATSIIVGTCKYADYEIRESGEVGESHETVNLASSD